MRSAAAHIKLKLRLLAMAGNHNIPVLLALSYRCGLRAGEVVRLKTGDIDSAQGIIRIVVEGANDPQ